jgi:ABC-type transport system involved in multi-copper enzyme maturation permease subunit
MSPYLADFRLSLLLLARSRLWVVAGVLAGVLAAVAWLSGQFSPRQPATVALDIGISFIRLAVPLLGLLQIQELLAREVDRRLILTSLTYPRPRASFLIARYAAVAVVALAMTVLLCAVLAGVVSTLGAGYSQGTRVALGAPFAMVAGLIWLDVAVILAFGVVLATVATTPHLVFLAGVGFMVIARSASTIVKLLQSEGELVVRGAEWYQHGLQWVQWLIPDLGALDVRPIALYGKMEFLSASVWALIVMPLAYIIVLLAIACLRFGKRQFN